MSDSPDHAIDRYKWHGLLYSCCDWLTRMTRLTPVLRVEITRLVVIDHVTDGRNHVTLDEWRDDDEKAWQRSNRVKIIQSRDAKLTLVVACGVDWRCRGDVRWKVYTASALKNKEQREIYYFTHHGYRVELPYGELESATKALCLDAVTYHVNHGTWIRM